jgi:excisionase family DNA binding protein
MTAINGIFNISQASEALGITRMTLYRWINSRKIESLEFANHQYITQSEIDRISKEKEASPKTE